MYPQRELAALQREKARLRERIASRRQECAAAAGRAAQPLVWADEGWALWRRVPPLAKIVLLPLGVLLGGRLAKPAGRVGAFARWLPAILQAVHRLRAAERSITAR